VWAADAGDRDRFPQDPTVTAAEDRADADLVMSVLLASPNRDEPGALLAAAKAYQALKSSRERAVRSRATTEGEPTA
jgi:hypothetical protein